MLQYSYGNSQHNRNRNWFVNRIANQTQQMTCQDQMVTSCRAVRSYSSNTYWKSPNSVETSSSPRNGIYVPPEMSVSSKFYHRPKSTNKIATVKGILKNKVENDAEKKDAKDGTDVSSPQVDNDAPAGAKAPGSCTKRVQFDGLSNTERDTKEQMKSQQKTVMHTQIPSETRRASKEYYTESKTGQVKQQEAIRPSPGGLYTFRRENSALSLNRKYLLCGDPNTKSELATFINKLKLVESAKLKKAEKHIKHVEQIEKEIEKSTERIRDRPQRPRIKSAMLNSADSGKADSKSKKHSSKPGRVKSASYSMKSGEKRTEDDASSPINQMRLIPRLGETKSEEDGMPKELLHSNSFLLNKNGSGVLNKVRRQRAISSYSRHNAYPPPFLKLWKPNESNCYKDGNGRMIELSISRQTHARNYCDSGKTSQILGWLYDVSQARTEDPDHQLASHEMENKETNKVEDEYIPSVD